MRSRLLDLPKGGHRLAALLVSGILISGFLAVTGALAQGRTDYFNTETVQVDPITVVEVGGTLYVAVVNTPDNSVELYETDETLAPGARFVTRIRTGLEPGSLLWVPELSRLFVTNALSDAITVVSLRETDGGGVNAVVERTDWVADEPVSVSYWAFDEDDGEGGVIRRHTLFTAHRDQDGFSWFDALTLQPLTGSVRILDATVQKGDIDDDGQDDLLALKSPRSIRIHCDQLFLLGEKGGDTSHYDFDLYTLPLTTATIPRDFGFPNTMNLNMAFASNDDLFIVGGRALNQALRDEANVAAAPTGFVTSTVTMVRGACSTSPSFKTRDVNLEPAAISLPSQAPGMLVAQATAGPISTQPVVAPVDKRDALAHLTSVVVFEPGHGPRKVFFTAFGSDKVGVLRPAWSSHPNSWPLNRIPIPPHPASGNPTSGPRGLALKPADAGNPNDPGDRLYVLNRLDNSFSIVDPVTETKITEIRLQHDPTPDYIRNGRQFLYGADFGNGFNSCASCHVDARTDGLAWDLGDGQSPLIDPLLIDNPFISPTNFPADKNFMVTQSLQGLLNFEMPPDLQDLVTNAPYHWRADREDFTKFNPAFQNLMGGSELTRPQMEAYEEFINSVSYPPNPRQPFNRVFTGTPFGPDFSGPLPTEAQLGLGAFHALGAVGEIACAHCHHLPEGSQNKIPLVLNFDNPFDPTENLGPQPVEGAALRGLFQKESRLDRIGTQDPNGSPISGLEGLIHTGFVEKDPSLTTFDFNKVGSINGFMRHFFSGPLCGTLNGFCTTLQGMNQFIHEFDWGVGPLVGIPYTVDVSNSADAGDTQTALDLMQGQALLANSGLAVQAWLGGLERGFRYDPILDRYVEEGGLSQVLTRTALLQAVVALRDRLVFIATPLGSERRVAAPSGQLPPPPPGGIPPSQVSLLPMVPNSAYEGVPTLTINWFEPPPHAPTGPDPAHGGFFAHTTRLLQMGLITTSPPAENAFGAGKRWEPARRFRVAAAGVEPNAELQLFIHDDPASSSPPDLTKTPEDAGQVVTRMIHFPIHPTGDVDPASEQPIWESAVELDPREFLRLMLGGPFAPGVSQAFNDVDFTLSEDPLDPGIIFDAANWNWVYVRVVNPNGLPGDGGWQRLRLQ